jgi:hypothetical protein
VGVTTIFYFLRFETSLLVAFYDSQGYGGGIRPRLHTGSQGYGGAIPLRESFADWRENTFLKG